MRNVSETLPSDEGSNDLKIPTSSSERVAVKVYFPSERETVSGATIFFLNLCDLLVRFVLYSRTT